MGKDGSTQTWVDACVALMLTFCVFLWANKSQETSLVCVS